MLDFEKVINEFFKICICLNLQHNINCDENNKMFYGEAGEDLNDLEKFYFLCKPHNLILDFGSICKRIINFAELEIEQQQYSPEFIDNNLPLVFFISDGGGEPVMFIKENSSVYADPHIDVPYRIADSFIQFLSAINELIRLVHIRFNIYDIYTDDRCEEYTVEFLNEFNEKIYPILGEENGRNFFDYLYG